MGKGSKSARTPVVDSDTLKTKQKLSALDLLSMGPIRGFTNSDIRKSTLLDDTQVVSDAGSENIKGVTIAANFGTPDQDYIEGFSGSKSETGVGVDVKKDTPVVRTINSVVDRMVLTLGGNALYNYTDQGDMLRTGVSLRVDISDGVNWNEVARMDLRDQKSEGEWLQPLEIRNLPAPPFDIRVVRETADATGGRLRNDTFWRSYTSIRDIKQSFPYCAVVGVTIDSSQFGSSPTRNYLIDGIICEVPSNYDPDTRTYSGFWNMQFKPAWTNNPAWIYYTLATNEIYGCGDFIDSNMLDIAMLYAVGKYCDELVDDGFGGKEPRFVCNGYLTEQRKAMDVLNDLASIFNGMPVWSGLQNSVVVDIPGDITAQYTNANIVGKFQYTSTELEDRHSVIEVTYCDPKNGYKASIEYVPDNELIALYGYNPKKITAFCTTSRGQARRLGLYMLESEKQETRAVSFKTGSAGLRNMPGDLIEIADNDWANTSVGGRIKSVDADNMHFELDRNIQVDSPIDFAGGEKAYLGLMKDREFVKTEIESITGNVIKLVSAVTDVLPDRVFSVTRVNVQPRTFRCLDISFDQKRMEFSVSGVTHSARKYSDIDNNVYFGPDLNTGGIYGQIPQVQNLTAKFSDFTTGSNLVIQFDCPTAGSNIRYRVNITREDLDYYNTDTSDTQIIMAIPDQGNYQVTITCVSMDNNRTGQPVSVGFTISAPKPVQSISWSASNFDISLRPVAGPVTDLGNQYQWYQGANEAEVLAGTNYIGRAYVMNVTGLKPNTEYWFGCRVINPLGVSSIVSVHTKTIMSSDDILSVIAPDIGNIDYIKDMNNDIAGLAALASLRVVDPNGANPRISGVYVNAGDAAIGKASSVDILADYFTISSPDKLERWVYFNTAKRMLTILGDIEAKSGTLENVTIKENCTILGTLTADRIVGDLFMRQLCPQVQKTNWGGANLFTIDCSRFPKRITAGGNFYAKAIGTVTFYVRVTYPDGTFRDLATLGSFSSSIPTWPLGTFDVPAIPAGQTSAVCTFSIWRPDGSNNTDYYGYSGGNHDIYRRGDDFYHVV